MFRLVFLALPFLIVSPSFAQESNWSGSAALGWLSASGNAENTSVNAKVDINYVLGKWHHLAYAKASGAQTESITTGERYNLGYKATYDIREFDYLFGLVNYEKDLFSGYREQLSEAVGYGRRILHSDTQTLNAEIGLGARQSELSTGVEEDDVIVRLGGDYLYKFSESASFGQTLAIDFGSDNTSLESISAVKAAIKDSLNLVVSYTIKNNSDVPVGTEKTDTFTAITLEYGF